ncbi:MAG: hypothetical protein K0R61_2460 [Microvirga sp.]|jgi:hypothetical protein|nr:hypothetical protein [Microvirga sp.]
MINCLAHETGKAVPPSTPSNFSADERMCCQGRVLWCETVEPLFQQPSMLLAPGARLRSRKETE